MPILCLFSEISQQLLDGLPVNLGQDFMMPKGGCVLLESSHVFMRHHHRVMAFSLKHNTSNASRVKSHFEGFLLFYLSSPLILLVYFISHSKEEMKISRSLQQKKTTPPNHLWQCMMEIQVTHLNFGGTLLMVLDFGKSLQN